MLIIIVIIIIIIIMRDQAVVASAAGVRAKEPRHLLLAEAAAPLLFGSS